MADCLVDRLVRCKLRAGKSLVVENVWYVAVAVLLPSSWPQPSATDDANVQQYCLTCLGQRSQPRTIYNCPAPPLHRTSQYFPTKFLFHTLHSHLLTSTNKHTFTHTTNMGLMWHKGFGGRRAGKMDPTLQSRQAAANISIGGGVVVDKHGVRRAPFRISCGGFSCFR